MFTAEIASVMFLNNCFTVASNSLLVYDYLLMLEDELSLIWNAKWALVKVLYLFSRYMPFADVVIVSYHQFFPHLTNEQCKTAYRINGSMFIVGMGMSEAVLTLRTWIIWNKDRRLTIGLPIFFFALWAAGLYIMYQSVESLQFVQSPSPFIKGCLYSHGSRVISIDWGLLLLYNTVNLTLMIIRVTSMYWSGVDSHLLKRLHKDGVYYYAFLFLLAAINVSFILSVPTVFVNLLSSVMRILHSNLSSRVILDIRRQVAKSAGRLESRTRSRPNSSV
ncbi:hypothetical protein F5887DRAFT_962000 [Amanita rubescens]|nr:hypothetical protein F5887DRAFT_962000 [Amanita rubescens]